MKTYLGIDIGGSKLLIGLLEETGKLLEKQHIPLPHPITEAVLLQKIEDAALSLFQKHPLPLAGGIAIPGLANAAEGIWQYAPFSKIQSFPIAAILQRKLHIPFYIENDANICAIGEQEFGAAKTEKNFIWMTVSNGIGAGIFINGQLYTGSYYNAGELGHCIIIPNGRKCSCGNSGCLEAYACGRAIAERYQEISGRPSSAKEIAQAARSGEKAAIDIFEETGYYIGILLGTAANVLNPSLIILGGGVSNAFSLLENGIKEGIHQHIYRAANPRLKIIPTPLGYEAALIGAAAHAKRSHSAAGLIFSSASTRK